MHNKQLKQMMNGAVILSVASFLTKLLSAVYKVPFQNWTGDEGFYVYQQVYPLYGIAAALSLNGLPVFISKAVAEVSSFEERRHLLKRLGLLLMVGCAGLFTAFWLGADAIAGWMGDPRLSSLIKSVSIVYLLVPFLAIGRGYFQGMLHMYPTAFSQIGEQVVRVAVILFAAYWFTQSDWSVYQMGSAAMSAAWIAGIAAVLILAYWLRKERSTHQAAGKLTKPERSSYHTLFKRLMTEGLTISVFGSLLLFLQLIDSFTVYNGLLDSGMQTDRAMAVKGVYDRGQPLLQLGMVVGTGFASSALPLLRQQLAENKSARYQQTAASALRITAVFASAATVGLIVLMPFFNQTLFSDTQGTDVLQVFVISVFLASLIGTCNAILQSMDRQRSVMTGLTAGLLVKALINRAMVQFFGTMGASAATVLSLAAVLAVCWAAVPKALKQPLLHRNFSGKLLAALLAMGTGVFLTVRLTGSWIAADTRWAALWLVLLGVGVGAALFVGILIRWNVLTLREWLSLPFGRKLLKAGQ